jgi:Rubisco LSMT substrate-binding
MTSQFDLMSLRFMYFFFRFCLQSTQHQQVLSAQIVHNLMITVILFVAAILHVFIDDSVQQRCMAPVINAANHHYTAAPTLADIVRYDTDQECFELKAGKHYNTGDQFYIIYGQYSNAKLLYSYGFALADNIYHSIDLWVHVLQSDSNAQLKRAILQENALTAQQQYNFSGTIRKVSTQQCTICAALLATARIIAMTQDELQQECEHLAFKGHMISVRNEQAVYTIA